MANNVVRVPFDKTAEEHAKKSTKGSTKSAAQHAADETERKKAWFKWAEKVLQEQFEKLAGAMTRDQLEDINFDANDPTVIMAINAMLHKKPRQKYFENLNAPMLKAILSSQFKDEKNKRKRQLIEGENEEREREEAREKDEEHAAFYGEFSQYKVTDNGGVSVFVTEKLKDGDPSSKWIQISRTRIDLWGITRSSKDDDWGAYVQLMNMDERTTLKAIPRTIINDTQGKIAGELAHLGVDVVREQREYLPDFLLSKFAVVDGVVTPLPRFLAVPTTGWYRVGNADNERWCFVLPSTTKFPSDLPSGELPIFQSKNLHLQHGIAIAGTAEEWREQIAVPFANNSNVMLSVGSAFGGPLVRWSGTPPGFFHIFYDSKSGKSLDAAMGMSVYGRPLIPREANADPFGNSWLSTVNAIGRIVLVRSSLIGFFEEINQGIPRDIADAAYRIANGVDKARLRGRDLESRPTYLVPGFSTGEEPMVDFLKRWGQRVTLGMRARFADVPAKAREGSVFEKFSADEISGLGEKYYPLLGELYGAVGDHWLQILVDMGPDEIMGTVSRHRREFLSRPKLQVLYKNALQYQRSVIDRFSTVATALRMAVETELLPWKSEETDAGIEACLLRWAEHDKLKLELIAVAIIAFMVGRQSWEGTASELLANLNGAVDSAVSLGHWLKKSENVELLRAMGIVIAKTRSETIDRARLIKLDRIST